MVIISVTPLSIFILITHGWYHPLSLQILFMDLTLPASMLRPFHTSWVIWCQSNGISCHWHYLKLRMRFPITSQCCLLDEFHLTNSAQILSHFNFFLLLTSLLMLPHCWRIRTHFKEWHVTSFMYPKVQPKSFLLNIVHRNDYNSEISYRKAVITFWYIVLIPASSTVEVFLLA